jgi:hypothetical protein
MREKLRRGALWSALHESLKAWISARFGVEVPAALLAAQTALMPSQGRVFPEVIELEHAIVAWYADRKKGGGKKITEPGPGRLTLEDPLEFSNRPYEYRLATRLQWELASELATIRAGRPGAPSPDAPHLRPNVWLPWAVISADPAAL